MKLALCVGVLGVVFLGITLIGAYSTREVVITRTESGFEPRNVQLRAGDVVIFKNESGKDFWPASDAHPSHGLLSDFDPKDSIPSGGSWQFTFTEIGIWPFHDHLHPTARGTIEVMGTNTSSVEACIERFASSTAQASCWGAELSRIVSAQGLSAALDRFSQLYGTSPAFAGNCHDVTHILGKEAYHRYQSDGVLVARPETSYCAYGFYHGFVEEMIALEGSQTYALSRTYCEELSRSNEFPSASGAKRAADACYHGVGHAFFDTLDSSYWGDDVKMVEVTTAQCELLTPDAPNRALCVSGVHNSLANAYNERAYNLTRDSDEPLAICLAQSRQYRASCYKEVVIAYLFSHSYSLERGLEFVRTVEPDYYLDALFAYIDDYLRHYLVKPTITDTHLLCSSLDNSAEKKTCVSSAIYSLIASGEPGKANESLVPFCTLFNESELRAHCFRSAGIELGVLFPPQTFRDMCSALDEPDSISCLGGQ